MFRNREISMNHIQPLMTMLSKEFIEILTFSGALQVFINFFLKCDNFRQVFCSNFILMLTISFVTFTIGFFPS